MIGSELQALAEDLSTRLKRAVCINDPHWRVLAYTFDDSQADDVTVQGILHRKAPAKAIQWATDCGIRAATGPIRAPRNPTCGIPAQVFAPIRHEGHSLGVLCVIDANTTLSEEELTVIDDAAVAASELLYRDQALQGIARARECSALERLLSNDLAVRHAAATEIADADLLAPTKDCVVLVAWLAPTPEDSTSNSHRALLALAIDTVRRSVALNRSLQLTNGRYGVLLVANDRRALGANSVQMLGRRLHDCVSDRLRGHSGWSLTVGIGEQQKLLVDAYMSYRQALRAARVADAVPSMGRVALWRDLGLYKILSQFPIEDMSDQTLHAGLLRLVAAPGGDMLLRTLECYLDVGCDVQRAARALSLHRATLYYRLHRIEDVALVSLSDGEDRLAIHLSIKLSHMARAHAHA